MNTQGRLKREIGLLVIQVRAEGYNAGVIEEADKCKEKVKEAYNVGSDEGYDLGFAEGIKVMKKKR